MARASAQVRYRLECGEQRSRESRRQRRAPCRTMRTRERNPRGDVPSPAAADEALLEVFAIWSRRLLFRESARPSQLALRGRGRTDCGPNVAVPNASQSRARRFAKVRRPGLIRICALA